MNKTIDLIQHLPLFVAEYEEIKQITKAENPEFNLIAGEKDEIQNNQYIITCNESGIERFERLLNVVPLPDDTLNSRISRCLMRWNETVPYTFRALKNRLDIMCGEGNYQLIPNFNEYKIELIVSLTLSGQTEELDNLLDYILPANIAVKARNELVRTVTGTVHGGGTTVEAKYFTVQSKVNLDHLLNGLTTGTGAVVTNKTIIIN